MLPVFISAQVTKERDVTGSAGDYSTTPTIHLSWTIGEVAVETKSVSGSLMVTEGFQQADDFDITGISEIEFNGEISVFPNPVGDVLHFTVTSEEDLEMFGMLYDAAGKKVKEVPAYTVYSTYEGRLDCHNISSGIWFLTFATKEGTVKTFTITKVE